MGGGPRRGQMGQLRPHVASPPAPSPRVAPLRSLGMPLDRPQTEGGEQAEPWGRVPRGGKPVSGLGLACWKALEGEKSENGSAGWY